MGEKMREEFQEHMISTGYTRSQFGINDAGEYENPYLQDYFEIWTASRAALCVELPPSMDMPEEDDCDGYEEYEAMEAITCTANGMRHACRAAIHEAGVSTK